MRTILVDKHHNIINEGDILKVKANLKEYPGMYHYGMYKVSHELTEAEIRQLMEAVELGKSLSDVYYRKQLKVRHEQH